MKALSIASLVSLALVGAACSQTEAPEAEVKATPVAAPAPADDGFNLRIPGDDTGAAVSDDGFNFSIPSGDGTPAPSGDFNLPSDIPTTDALSDLPELEAPLGDETPIVETDDEPIIRLD